MPGIDGGALAGIGPAVGSIIRTVKTILGIPDDVEVVVQAIEAYMPRALDIASEFAQAELVKAQAQMKMAEAALMREYRELLQLQLRIIEAESRRELREVHELQRRQAQMWKALERKVDDAMAQVLTILGSTLREQLPNYRELVERPLLRLMPPAAAS